MRKNVCRWVTESLAWDFAKELIWPWFLAHTKTIAASLMGIVVAAVGRTTDIPIFYVLVGSLLAIMATIWIVNGLQQMRPDRKAHLANLPESGRDVTPVVASEARDGSDAMSRIVFAEKQHLQEFVFTYDRGVDFHHLKEMESYLLVWFDITSSSVGRMKIGYKVEGKIEYQGIQLKDAPQLEGTISLIRGTKERLTLRQYVSNEIAGDILHRAEAEVKLTFAKLKVSVVSTHYDGTSAVTDLPLPSQLTPTIPSARELQGIP